ncbi:MAG: metallophosphoesterase family protein [Bacilli bacterium]|nr:metallophosphoesterase family protein [Bacilli bacterium]
MDALKIEPISESKIIIISDTHIGSIYENFSYTDQVYEYAIKNNIKTILHGGDLFQGPYKGVSNKYRKPENQILHLQKDYPKDDSIINKIVLGNHDFQMFQKDWKLMKMMRRPDLEVVAIRKSYFDWKGNLISVSHKCPKYEVKIPNLETLVNFAGHSHKFTLHEKKGIMIPTLSDDTKFDSPPGFLVAEITEEGFYLELISFDKTMTEPKLVLKKSLNE